MNIIEEFVFFILSFHYNGSITIQTIEIEWNKNSVSSEWIFFIWAKCFHLININEKTNSNQTRMLCISLFIFIVFSLNVFPFELTRGCELLIIDSLLLSGIAIHLKFLFKSIQSFHKNNYGKKGIESIYFNSFVFFLLLFNFLSRKISIHISFWLKHSIKERTRMRDWNE